MALEVQPVGRDPMGQEAGGGLGSEDEIGVRRIFQHQPRRRCRLQHPRPGGHRLVGNLGGMVETAEGDVTPCPRRKWRLLDDSVGPEGRGDRPDVVDLLDEQAGIRLHGLAMDHVVHRLDAHRVEVVQPGHLDRRRLSREHPWPSARTVAVAVHQDIDLVGADHRGGEFVRHHLE